MSYRNPATAEAIRAELANGRRTTNDLAFVLGQGWQGVASCLNGMFARGEVRRTVAKPGKPSVWWIS